MFSSRVVASVERVTAALSSAALMLITAESCTGGLIAGAVTERAGSSAVFDRGFLTYSNAAKSDLLEVPADLIADCGAVSAPVAAAMAQGALRAADGDGRIAIAVTGVAGPGGGSAAKPVGLVHIAVAVGADFAVRQIEQRYGEIGRSEIRLATVVDALDLVSDVIDEL
ncbi:MAG: CinA family protein [Pseudomonadota bacterium]